MKKITIIFPLLFCLGFMMPSLQAQDQECGTVLTAEQARYMDDTRRDRERITTTQFRTTTMIPLVAHIVRTSNGTGGLSSNDLTTAMNDLNTAFAQLDFQFDLCTVNYIDEDAFYNTSISPGYAAGTVEYNMAQPNRVADKVNVFFIPNTNFCGWSSFPSYLNSFGKDWTIMKNSCATNGSTFPHEIGHFLNLYHTHQGPSSGIGIVAAELVDGSNCGPNVGDELCDTPADPRLSNCVTASCVYVCNNTDANGDSYNPDVSNLMSYAPKACRTFFSPEQRTRMEQSFLYDRSYLGSACSTSSCVADLTETTNYGSGDNITREASNSITASNTIGAGAVVEYDAGYEITLVAGFTAEVNSEFQTSLVGCTPPAKTSTTNTPDNGMSMATFDNANQNTIGKIRNYPNPFGESTIIEFELENDTEVHLSIYNITGQEITVLIDREWKTKGIHQAQFNSGELSNGTYFYTLNAGNKIYSGRMSLIR